MQCVECGSEMMTGKAHHEFFVSGVRVVGSLPSATCPQCGAGAVEDDSVRALELSAADALARRGVRTGEVFKFMRKALGLRAADLGKLIDIDPTTISRWECGHQDPDIRAFALLAEMVADQIHGRTETRDRLEALTRPQDSRPSFLELPAPDESSS